MTLQDLKNMLSVGSRWHMQHVKGWCPGVREIAAVEGNSFAFLTERTEGLVLSWTKFPLRREVVLRDRQFIIIDEHNEPLFTYTREDKFKEVGHA